jgi:hypothetical protein
MFLGIVVTLIVLASLTSSAQSSGSSATLHVMTRDESGQPIMGVDVQLKHRGLVVGSKTTNEQGQIEFAGLAAGTYELSVLKEEFEPAKQGDVVVTPGSPVDIEFTLSPRISVKDEVNVQATADSPLEQSASPGTELERAQLKNLPSTPATVADALPLVPGVVRTADGEVQISGSSEHHSALLVNSADVTDPGTGQLGVTVPVDMVETISVLQTPYFAQYGRFTAGVVSVETRRGGEKWHFELNDPAPEFRVRSNHLTGLRAVSPRVVLNGPLIRNRFYFAEGLEYNLRKQPVKTLSWPFNETTERTLNSFTQLDYILSPTHMLTGTFHLVPRSISFANLDAFNPQPVTPNFRTHDYTTTLLDRITIRGGVLQSTIAVKQFEGRVWAQGTSEMFLTPIGNRGNYFNDQNRTASRIEWLESFSLQPIQSHGIHNVAFGSSLTSTHGRADVVDRPVDILTTAGQLVKRIDFVPGSAVDRGDLEVAAFGQDHWILNSKLALDTGMRLEHQDITETSRLAPRTGFSWTPLSHRPTIVRGGIGVFYDRVPLNVYSFPGFPQQVVTTYGPGGSILDGPRHFANMIAPADGRVFPFVRRSNIPGDFAPYSVAWNVGLDQRISRILNIQAGYLQSNSYDMVLVTPSLVQGQDALVLRSGGRSRYQQLELTARVSRKEGQFSFSYVHSRALGDLNEFSNYIGNSPFPVVPPQRFADLPSDVPNHFLVWGQTRLPQQLRLSSVLEYRNGFPYQARDVEQNYVSLGNPDMTRFPTFFALDLSIARDFRVSPKYGVTITGRGFNLTDHFNALAVHNNTADPQFGKFFGTYSRRFRIDFDVNF